jgi:arylsulfatase
MTKCVSNARWSRCGNGCSSPSYAEAGYVYFPNHAEVPEAQAVMVRGRSFAIGALVDLPERSAEGVLFAQGSRFGGHALYVKDNRLHYVNTFVGMFEQMIAATEDLPIGKDLILSVSFDKDGDDPSPVATGVLSVYHGEKMVGEGRIKTQPGGFMIAGEGLAIGRDVGDQVTEDYARERPFRFAGGTIKRVAIDVSGEPYIDLEREAAGNANARMNGPRRSSTSGAF